MSSLITLICVVGALAPAAIGNIFAYPVSKTISLKISNYISKVLATRLFGIMKCYKRFFFWSYHSSKEQLPEQFIIISNHQSLLDIPVYMRFMPEKDLRFVAKDALARHVPLVSEMLRSEQHCMIPRTSRSMDAMNEIRKFGKRVLERKQIPVIFPEGTRTRTGDVGKFHPAGLRMLSEATNLPIAVCALDGGWHLRDLKKFFTNLEDGCYRVKVLKVFDAPKSKEESNFILEEAKRLIQEQLDIWRAMPSDKKF